VLQKLQIQIEFPPLEAFETDPYPCFLVTYFHRGYIFSLACRLATAGSYASLETAATLAVALALEIDGELPAPDEDKFCP
jgi:hypothetical protein